MCSSERFRYHAFCDTLKSELTLLRASTENQPAAYSFVTGLACGAYIAGLITNDQRVMIRRLTLSAFTHASSKTPWPFKD